ncbi:hypothetical protein O181_001383 [Austropuccinia psidii MF-1]|uniref:Ribosomal protein L22e n=1 Tax=Austropuccinia psidii MF-1 TaxID=1389203 RepID=A0A9Q3BAN6_9BASI|nr:hypothetical protein [Austropuccinia psidii MF-1]
MVRVALASALETLRLDTCNMLVDGSADSNLTLPLCHSHHDFSWLKSFRRSPVRRPPALHILRKMAPVSKTAAPATSKPLKFIVDFSKPSKDGVFDGRAFEKFLHDRIKVEGRTGQLGDKIKIESEGPYKLAVSSTIPFSKRYLKYLTKKFLKKHQVRNYIRVTATSKSTFELKYFLVDDAEEGDDDE